MAEFSNITIANFARGIHARTGENKIPEGFVEDLLNMDAIGQQLRKRTGYESYAGCLPHRVSTMDYTASNDEIRLTFDGIVDLSNVTPSPLIVYGRSTLTSNGGDFTGTDALEYYDYYTAEVKDTLSSGSGTLTKTLTQRPISDTIYITQVAEADSLVDNSWTQVYLSAEQQVQSDDSLDLDYTVPSDTDVFVYYKGKTASAGSVYVDDTASIDMSGNLSITAATHGLNNFNITAAFYRDISSEWERVYPDTLTINQSTGQVDANFNGLVSTTIRCILTAVNVSNILTDTLAASSTTEVTLSSPTSPWVIFQCYEDDGSTYTWIEPDSIMYDESADTITLTFINNSASTPVSIFYEYGEIAANSLTVTSNANISSDGTDTAPQLTVWGLCHNSTIYGGSRDLREGWVTHIDSYRRTAEDRLVTGLGGNLYSAQTQTEIGPTYGLTTLYPNLRARSESSDRVIGPLFQTSNLAGLTAGYIYSSDVTSDNTLEIESITYNSGTGYVDVVINASSVSYLDSSNSSTTLSAILTTGQDKLTLSGTEYARNSGTFTIEAVDETSADSFTLSVSNSAITSSIWNEQDVGGAASCTTSKIVTASNSSFIPSDILSSSAFSSDLTVTSVSTTTVYVSGVTANQTIEGSVRIVGSRSSSVIPLRDNAGNAKVKTSDMEGFVNGDTISYTGATTDYNVQYTNASADDNVTLSDDGSALTISAIVNSNLFAIGQKIVLTQAGDYTGEHTVLTRPSATSLTVASVTSGSGSGTLLGYTIELDTSFSWADTANNSKAISVDRRWIPLEAPDATDSLPATTNTTYFTDSVVSNKPFIRSTIVNDNMYFTTGDDSILKFDGTNIYRAGLFKWQPNAFLCQDTGAGATIPVIDTTSGTVSAISGNRFTLPLADQSTFSIGQRIEHSQDNERYTVTEIDDDGTNSFIKVDKAITGSASGTLAGVSIYGYYFRLNAIDANNNLIASATTGAQDYRIEIGADAAVEGRLIGMPVWDIYDYDRLEVEIYRTFANDLTEYRRILTIPLSFEDSSGYVDFVDTVADDVWSFLPLDPVSSALLGAELGTTWTEPQRAKYITSANNQLALGNVKSYPRLDVQIVNDTDEIAASDLAGDIWHFKRQNTLTDSTTDMINQVKYEFINSSSTTILPTTTASTVDAAVADDVQDNSGIQFQDTSHGFTTGMKVQLTTTDTLPTGLSLSTDYYIIRVDDDNYKFATTIANAASATAISWTDDGTGVHTVTPQHNITRTASTFTIEDIAHGLSAGDWIYLFHGTATSTHTVEFAGWWQIASANTNDFTINYTNSASVSTNDVDTYITATAPADVPVWIGTDGNFDTISGRTDLVKLSAMTRLSQAINASMRMTDTSISGYETFTPWLTTNAGGEYAAGQMIVEQPKIDSNLDTDEAFELDVPSFSGYKVFVNGINRAADASIQAVEYLYPSRILVSYPNYPELFDNPLATLPLESDSVIDVNPSDGQEITGIIPFFGESSFGDAQKSGVIVVFKTNSIYLVDISRKAQGASPGLSNPVQKIESRGLGCTAPYSIAYTRNGIIFANESGIYRLNQNLTIDYVGDKMERKWQENVNKDYLSIAQGHHAPRDNKYKLSVPIGSSSISNSQVYVYNHAQEVEVGEGAWSRYDNHEATGWANLASEEFFASIDGRVFRIRSRGTASDFRDDSEAITATATLKSEDFGLAGIRKLVSKAMVDLRIPYDFDNTTVSWATDMKTTFTNLPSFSADTGTRSVGKFRFDLNDARGNTFQLKISNDGLDEPLELTGVDLEALALSTQGTTKASNFSS